MKTKKDEKKLTGFVERRKFVIDPDFVDPLLETNEEDFDEISVEEIPYYYNVFLGCEYLNDKHNKNGKEY